MSYQKYNTRNSGRYNTPGQFVPAAEIQQQIPTLGQQQPQQYAPPPKQQNQVQQNQNMYAPNMNTNMQDPDIEMKPEVDDDSKPHWMKTKLAGVKKVSNKERRRRQNANLRRLLSPKNALMVLSEMMPNQVAAEFTVEAAANMPAYYGGQQHHSFCADLTVEGTNYKGYGENKLAARNAAAEQAIRDLIIRKISKMAAQPNNTAAPNPEEVSDDSIEEPLPMIQLASFALHKLFSEWEYDGHKVPQLKPAPQVGAGGAGGANGDGASDPGAPRPRAAPRPVSRPLPLNACSLHPCMLLSYMRPAAEWRDLQAEGTTPQNTIFTIGVHVDGNTYLGKGPNKKEARKAAARSACETLFSVVFEPNPTANAPQQAPQ